jgi:hypothetical protein
MKPKKKKVTGRGRFGKFMSGRLGSWTSWTTLALGQSVVGLLVVI